MLKTALLVLFLLSPTCTLLASQASPPGTGNTMERARLTQGVFTWRTMTARKDSFERMLSLSQTWIWPFYEKMGARNVAFWLEDSTDDATHETIHMITHYLSREHWQATRQPWARGEDDEAFLRMANAMFERSSYVVDQQLRFVTGYLSDSPPSYIPNSSDSPLTDPDDHPKVCRQLTRESPEEFNVGSPSDYCGCISAQMGKDVAGWSRAYHIAWLRAGGYKRPEISSPRIENAHRSCTSGN